MIIVAHRGWSGKAPENTLAAFKLALEESQIQEVELDVHLSKDGIPVVIHDHTLARTTNGFGFVKDFTFEELSKLDAGSWFDSSYADEKIPSLEETLQLFKHSDCKVVIELKQLANYYNGLEKEVVNLIHQYEMDSQVVVSSFDHESVMKIKEYDAAIDTGLIFLGRPTLLVEQMKYTGAKSLSIHYGFVTKEMVNVMLDYDINVGVWTVDEEEVINKFVKYPKDFRITTNHPDRVIKALQVEM
ncbi:glycerophosphodiester phosphodiesterase [Halalkalibacter urbisdiaboli]|uniref:glycerophosphodiester phosphodiesterase n=1 Tax=Halalkalibacter urbisdiaboli TaxID=1960589 RepID=UPI000B434B52|nr:glycerophosphodiester phosphodiesterase family protein [Halalkalibacter urbisdiaboli]